MKSRYLLTIRELSKVLGKRPETVHRLIRDGKLPFEVIEDMGVRMVRRSDVEEWLRCPIEDEAAA